VAVRRRQSSTTRSAKVLTMRSDCPFVGLKARERP
jgi:hypothetical protein